MGTKDSAHYMRQFRERLRSIGLVKKEVWILPEHSLSLQRIEQMLRKPLGAVFQADMNTEEHSMEMRDTEFKKWTIQSMGVALSQNEGMSVRLIEGEEPSLHLSLQKYGDLPMHMVLVRNLILIEVFLWESSVVKDEADLNKQILRMQKMLPNTSFALTTGSDGKEHYVMFAAMRGDYEIQEVIEEINALGRNAINATEALMPFLSISA